MPAASMLGPAGRVGEGECAQSGPRPSRVGVEVERCVVQGAGQGVGLGGRHPDRERARELQAGAQDEPDLLGGDG